MLAERSAKGWFRPKNTPYFPTTGPWISAA